MGILSPLATLAGPEFDVEFGSFNVRKFEPKEQKPDQVVDLTFEIHGVTPWHLTDSGLLEGSFRRKTEKVQLKLDDTNSDPALRAAAEFNAGWDNLPLDSGERHDEDASHKLQFNSKTLKTPLIARPQHGIVVKKITPGEAVAGVPTVSIKLTAKGCDTSIAGKKLLIDQDLKLVLALKSSEELAEDTAKKLEEKSAPGQQTLPTEPEKAGRGKSKNTAAVDKDFDKLEQQKSGKVGAKGATTPTVPRGRIPTSQPAAKA